MIKYALRCDSGHEFESWFNSAASYDEQLRRGFVECPFCGTVKVGKQIMAPALRSTMTREEAPGTMTLPSEPDAKLRAMIRELHAHVRANSEDVGTRFAEEARAIHDGDAEERSIRGQATREEAKALQEDGIGVLPLPPLPDQLN
ncbi:MAG: DUF1178 family protein [Beijerinckiaceae bacterium]